MTRQASMPGLVLIALAVAVTSHDVLAHPPIFTDDKATGSDVLFSEGFEDTKLNVRGWYDGNDRFTFSDDAAVGRQSIQYHFPKGKLLMLCYDYDSANGQYTVAIMKISQVLGSLTVLVLAASVAFMVIRDRRRSARSAGSATPVS